ncbi:TPA: response regulator, partial [Candidatus Poribacteria bacterium]|nr:response regulator [Candidatus Poribacteria bacterium]
CEVISAMNVEDAIKMAIERHPDLAILDMRMPKNVESAGLFSPYAGADICKELRNNLSTRDIPVIMLTVMSESEGIPESLEAGANEYLTKPFNPDELLKVVGKYIK